jgi:DNA-binding response OmpR family regulator
MRIAIIEDSEDWSNEYRAALEAGLDDPVIDQLFNEDQARVALARAAKQGKPYDLITLDIDLSENDPGVDRMGGLRILQSLDPGQMSTVLVASGRVSEELEFVLRNLRVADVLRKPHTNLDYLRAVRLGLQVQSGRPAAAHMLTGRVVAASLELDPLRGPPKWRGKDLVACTLTHQRLLFELVTASPKPVSLRRLARALPSVNASDENVRVQMSQLRTHLRIAGGTDDFPIMTKPGIGYAWAAEES